MRTKAESTCSLVTGHWSLATKMMFIYRTAAHKPLCPNVHETSKPTVLYHTSLMQVVYSILPSSAEAMPCHAMQYSYLTSESQNPPTPCSSEKDSTQFHTLVFLCFVIIHLISNMTPLCSRSSSRQLTARSTNTNLTTPKTSHHL